jgi:hypothetical protein
MNNVNALFADIMGFAAAVEHFSRVTTRGLNDYGAFTRLDPAFVSDNPDPGKIAELKILHAYKVFHEALQELQTLRGSLRIFDQMIIFSDSAFIISKSFFAPLDSVAAELMHHCFVQGVPLRIGLARGDFISRPFSTIRYPDGLFVTEAPFLGSAVIRAYRAQSLGCPGFRILVHPSIHIGPSIETHPRIPGPPSFEPDEPYNLAHEMPRQIVPLPPKDRSEFSVAEVNWLRANEVYRQGRSRMPDLTELLSLLHSMREGVTDERALRHYEATERAIRRLHAIEWGA